MAYSGLGFVSPWFPTASQETKFTQHTMCVLIHREDNGRLLSPTIQNEDGLGSSPLCLISYWLGPATPIKTTTAFPRRHACVRVGNSAQLGSAWPSPCRWQTLKGKRKNMELERLSPEYTTQTSIHLGSLHAVSSPFILPHLELLSSSPSLSVTFPSTCF